MYIRGGKLNTTSAHCDPRVGAVQLTVMVVLVLDTSEGWGREVWNSMEGARQPWAVWVGIYVCMVCIYVCVCVCVRVWACEHVCVCVCAWVCDNQNYTYRVACTCTYIYHWQMNNTNCMCRSYILGVSLMELGPSPCSVCNHTLAEGCVWDMYCWLITHSLVSHPIRFTHRQFQEKHNHLLNPLQSKRNTACWPWNSPVFIKKLHLSNLCHFYILPWQPCLTTNPSMYVGYINVSELQPLQ